MNQRDHSGNCASADTLNLGTKRLRLVAQTRESARAQLEKISPTERAEVSSAWLALLENSSAIDPWIHGFILRQREGDIFVGQCGFKKPPTPEGSVEIAYGIAAEYQGKGYATEAAEALVIFAFADPNVRVVLAHTLPEANASTRVLTKCGFQFTGEVIDPEDGRVWRWERKRVKATT